MAPRSSAPPAPSPTGDTAPQIGLSLGAQGPVSDPETPLAPAGAVPFLSFASDSGDVRVDLGTLMETRMLLQGTSRAGKTWTLYQLLQETYGLVQHIIIDRESDFAPLRERYDYLLVGSEGDLPADLEADVEGLVRQILALKANVIFDLSDLCLEDQQEYVRRVAHTLAHLPRSSGLWTPALVVVDEIPVFAPEVGKGKSVATRALSELASMGGKRGFCLIGATQRMSQVNKGVAGLLENKVVLRVGQVDAKRAIQELDLGRGAARQLRSFPRGHGYAYGPAICVDPLVVRTRPTLPVTPRPKGVLRPPPPPAPEAVQALLAQFRELPSGDGLDPAEAAAALEAARERADELEAEVSRLEGVVARFRTELSAARAAAAVSEEEGRRRWAALLPFLLGFQLRGSLADGGDLALAALAQGGHLAGLLPTPGPEGLEALGPALRALLDPAGVGEGARPAASGDVQAGPLDARILGTLARLAAAGVHDVHRSHVAVLAGQSPRSSWFATSVAAMRKRGLLEKPGPGLLRLSAAGHVAAPAAPGAPASLQELGTAWRAYLPPEAGNVLGHLLEVRRQGRGRTGCTIETLVGLTGSTFPAVEEAVRDLVGLGLVVAEFDTAETKGLLDPAAWRSTSLRGVA